MVPPSAAQHTTEMALRLLTRRLRIARYRCAVPDEISLSTRIAVPATTTTLKRVRSTSNGTVLSTTPESTNGMAIVLSPMVTKPTMTMKARSMAARWFVHGARAAECRSAWLANPLDTICQDGAPS